MNRQTATAHASFNWEDPLLLDSQLTEDERMVREAAAAYCQERLAPRVLEAFRTESTDPAIFREMVVEMPGGYRGIGAPVKLSRTPASYRFTPLTEGDAFLPSSVQPHNPSEK